ncbi:MAG: sirohydrochlorin cobaltochelatase [Desulfobulbus sp.]|nr:sirohydrochlorin cobaltochelatase [Desulfobulbus sp.]
MWRILMRRQWLIVLCAAFALSGFLVQGGHAADKAAKDKKGPAILLVTFGTSVESAQGSFRTIERRVKAAFPGTEVRWAYTSKIIRQKLAKEGVAIDSPEMALARLMEDGYTKVAVQSLHMIPGAEFHEVNINARLFEQMSGGFDKVTVSWPLLVSNETMEKTLKEVLTRVVPKERRSTDAVVLMGHGTHHPSDAIYSALMYMAQKMDPNLFVGTVEGAPSFDEIKEMLVEKKIRKAYLVPFMTVAGDHAMNDMAGDEPDSWKSGLAGAGIEAVPVMKGLAEFPAIADMWVEQLKKAMAEL